MAEPIEHVLAEAGGKDPADNHRSWWLIASELPQKAGDYACPPQVCIGCDVQIPGIYKHRNINEDLACFVHRMMQNPILPIGSVSSIVCFLP